jgi:hypothetical protein
MLSKGLGIFVPSRLCGDSFPRLAALLECPLQKT